MWEFLRSLFNPSAAHSGLPSSTSETWILRDGKPVPADDAVCLCSQAGRIIPVPVDKLSRDYQQNSRRRRLSERQSQSPLTRGTTSLSNGTVFGL